MKLLNSVNKFLYGLILIVLLFFVIGIAYAFFSADLFNSETGTTITAGSGTMKIEYSGGPQITVSDLAPSTTPFASKTFTIKANNTTTDMLKYRLFINKTQNTFSTGGITYTLSGTNTSGKGTLVPDVSARKSLATGAGNELIGTGSYTGAVTNAVHTYELKLYFYLTENDQMIDLGKSFTAKIVTESYN
ncbi:MAG: hypothetical protein PHF21_00360 [Bacilli bacterium]|nr:hypothetical protein [Bacilli bacterium]